MAVVLAAFAGAQSPAAPRQNQPARPAGAGAPQQQKLPAPPVTIAPPVVRFGDVAPLSTNPAKFTIANTGPTPLKVIAAQPSCKCTGISNIVGQTIPPGGSIELSASLKAPPYPGPKDATVTIRFEGNWSPIQAKLEGEVVMGVRAEPSFIDALRDVRTGKLTVRSSDGKPFRILQAGGAAPAFEGFDPAKDEPRASYVIGWNLAGRDAAMPIWWTVFTDRPDCPLVPLRVRNENTGSKWDMARFDRQWMVPDSVVIGGAMKAGEAKEMTFELEYYNPLNRNQKKDNWATGIAVASKSPDVLVELIEAKPTAGDFYEVKVRATPKAGTKGPLESAVVISTATGSAEIPLLGFVNP